MLSVDRTGRPAARPADPQAPVFDSLVDGMEHGTEVGPGLFRDGRTAIFGPLSDLAHRRYCCRAAATGPVTSRGPGTHTHPAFLAVEGVGRKGTCAEGDGIVAMATLVNIRAPFFSLSRFFPDHPRFVSARAVVLIVEARFC
ncbi:hypothetical protein CEXT_13651 [Caerostris extrusa]|uniref:Uncharacterized protein n=1 Tax=Caerostris extrusa TaxID=172846 RepID=A0AAV4YB34_CAEEX|nr:hypothetical protein CEXT_13651 [Caerostris extrusa]